MKTLCNIIFLLIAPALLLANGTDEGKIKKEKRINKAYKVNDDAGIDIDNQFGPVFVTTWDEDKIELDIVIKVSGNSEDWVDRRLGSIDVDINALTTLVTAKTRIGNVSGRSGNGSSMEINYTVKIPKKGTVKVSNKYGDVLSTDIFGAVKLNVQYGNVKLARLNSGSNVLNLQYCGSVNIEKIKNGQIKADYSKLNIGDFDALSLETDYTDIRALGGGNVEYNSDYGKLSFGKVNNLAGKGDYLDVSVSELGGNLSIFADYTTVKVNNVNASAGNIAVSGNYNTASVEYNDSYAFDFEVSGKYTNMRLDDDLEVTTRIETNKDKIFKGYHKRSGGKKVTVLGQYGNISLKSNR